MRAWSAEDPALYTGSWCRSSIPPAPSGRSSRSAWVPLGRGPRPPAARQRSARPHPWRQPPRSQPAHRQGRHRGRPRRPRHDEAVQRQHGPLLALPERCSLLRPVRRARPVRDRRGRRREPRLDLRPVPRPTVLGHVRRSRGPDGPARQEPRVNHRVVPRQRERLWRGPRRDGGLHPPLRPHPPLALRGGGTVMEDLFADAPVTDIVCPMYPTIGAITRSSRRCPQHTRRPPARVAAGR